ncbi:MAG: hypothetical protein WCK58_15900, partial [Chloroflexota bacterium]
LPIQAPTPRPTEIPGPPTAALAAAGGIPVRGELGTFTWEGMGSDSPFLVVSRDRALTGSGPFTVTIAPPLAIADWSAAWVRVSGGTTIGRLVKLHGSGTEIAVAPPPVAGDWSLGVDIRFATGDTTAFYWRVEVRP